MTQPLKYVLNLLIPLLAFGFFCGCEQKEKHYTIGVLQWTENIHPYTTTYTGVLDSLNDMGYFNGVNLSLEYINVEQDQNRAHKAAQHFVEQKVDLILALGTGSSIAALESTQEQEEVPIVFSIAGAPEATGIINSFEHSGRNITGVSMKIPVAVQFQVISELIPDLKRIGILYCSEMPQAIATGQEAAKASIDFGWENRTVSITKNELAQLQEITSELARQVDAIYIPTDPILGLPENLDKIIAIADQHGKPVIGVAKKFLDAGLLAAVHCDFYQLGRQTGELIVQIFRGVQVQKIPSQRPVVKQVSLNLNKARQLQLPINRNSILKADYIVD